MAENKENNKKKRQQKVPPEITTKIETSEPLSAEMRAITSADLSKLYKKKKKNKE